MLCGRQHTLCLTGVDPCCCELSNALRIASKRAGADDRIVRLHVEVAVRRIDPVDAELSCFTCGDGGRAADCLHVLEESDRGEWRQSSLTRKLLARSALQIRSYQ